MNIVRVLCRAAAPVLLVLYLFVCVSSAFCQDGGGNDLAKASLEDLLNIKVTSVSKKEQTLSRTASAVFVITQEDIRRSGATNIPDLLREVPGLDVAQINGSTWAISARGFNAQFSNKLLVMIDGRTVYTPNFAGVYWDTVDVPLQDIDRIEVIRGPGGAVWGVNAVNGVISIFTKKAGDTRGGLLEAGSGNVEKGFGTMQYGGEVHKTDYRIFAKGFDRGAMAGLDGESGEDGWHMFRSGFRTDTTISRADKLMFEGDFYDGAEGEQGFYLPSITSPSLIPIAEEIGMWGGSLNSIWEHAFSARSDGKLQVSFNRYKRNDPLEPEKRNTLDIGYQDQIRLGSRHEFVWGLGYRYTGDMIGGSLTVSFDPPSKALQLFNGFVQDEIALRPDRFYLTLGTKLEHNSYTGLEVMPTIRMTLMLDSRRMLWAAASRAVRSPSRNDTNLVVNIGSVPGPGDMPMLGRFSPNPDFQDEHLLAYELGFRAAITKRISFDFASYYNAYDNLETTEPSEPFFEATPPPAHIVQPLSYQNLMDGETHGIEIAGNWQVTNRWQLNAGYALEEIHMRTDFGSQDIVTPLFVEHGAPRHSAQVRSHYRLRHDLTWDAAAYFVDRLSNQGPTADIVIPAYTRVDTGLTWSPGERFTVGVYGQNLLRDLHPEFEDVFGSMQSSEMRRSGFARFTWTF